MHAHLHSHEKRGKAHDDLHDWMHSMVEAEKDTAVDTVLSVVYVTLSATFTGSTAGYSTVTGDSTKTTAADTDSTQATTSATSAGKTTKAVSTATSTVTSKAASATTGTKSTAAADASSSSTADSKTSSSSKHTDTATAVTSSAQSSHTTLQTSHSTSSTSVVSATAIDATTTTSSTATASATSAASSGMSGGAKAGVGIGLVLILGLVAALIVFAIRRKKAKEAEGTHQRLDDEKSASVLSTNGAAPRLSLRPVTQFMGIGEPKVKEMTSATGGLSSLSSANRNSAWERRPATSNSVDAGNPFGAGAETVDSAAAEKAAEQNALNAPIPVPVAGTTNPFADRNAGDRPVSPISPTQTSPDPQAGVAAAAAGTRAIVSPNGPNNVHRIQLDFKPSMEDELELRAGQIVRIVHEYDDGWALCMRMDRSKQGVAPRQCLSKMPIKPRPAGPPNGRPSSPAMRNVSGPPNGRQGPGPRNNPMYPAPLSPSMPGLNGAQMTLPSQRQRAHSQSQSVEVAQGGRPLNVHRRSASMNQLVKANGAAPGPSPPRVARKPVPGQAL